MAQAKEGEKSREMSALEIIKGDALRHKKFLVAAAMAVLLALSFFFYSDLKALLLIIAFIVLGALSRLWQRILPLPFGADLIMLVAVISGVLYGSMAGAVAGFLSFFLSAVLTQEDLASMWPSFLAMALTGYVAGFVPVSDISIGGIILTIFYDAIIFAAYALLGLAGIRTFIFVVTHIAFNYYLFYNVAPVLINLLA